MTPAERLDLIKAIKPVLLGMNTSDIFLHISEFASEFVGSWDYWLDQHGNSDDVDEWCTWLVRQLTGDELHGLHDYLIAAGPPIDESMLPWREGEFRLFLSHIAGVRRTSCPFWQAPWSVTASMVSSPTNTSILVGSGPTSFARACSPAMPSLLCSTMDSTRATGRIRKWASSWASTSSRSPCEQEPIRTAFLVQSRGYRRRRSSFSQLRFSTELRQSSLADIVQVLAAEQRTQTTLRDALVSKLTQSRNWDMSNEIIDVLRQCPKITKDQYFQLRATRRRATSRFAELSM